MKPLLLPASTSIALLAGALATILVWALKQWVGVDVPDNIRDAFIILATAAGSHFTTDSPTATVAREAVTEASDAADKAQVKSDAKKKGEK